ncbi:hypothetical protein AFLA_010337 [Aspergillus flavus NRRL3357]|nr:hypothetical protein AFLA_010337 [Aspergillus flavus NRRL3357]
MSTCASTISTGLGRGLRSQLSVQKSTMKNSSPYSVLLSEEEYELGLCLPRLVLETTTQGGVTLLAIDSNLKSFRQSLLLAVLHAAYECGEKIMGYLNKPDESSLQ